MITDEHGDATAPPAMGPITREESAEQWEKTADDILKTLPEPSLRPLPKEQASDLGKYKNKLGITAEKAWANCADTMRKYDADSCKAYREELDTLLVFAGLFSAVVTAFTVESYKWLQEDPNDIVIGLLIQIAHPEVEIAPQENPPDPVSVRINLYWFLSLLVSLFAALLAILCKQWVREFERDAHQSHEQFISIRQMKLEGFMSWGVGSAVATVPLVLELALGLFVLGLFELLRSLDSTITGAAIIPIVLCVGLYAFTTLLPAVQVVLGGQLSLLRRVPQVPFKSPQVVTLLTIPEGIILFIDALLSLFHRIVTYLVFYCRHRTSPRQTAVPSRPYRPLRDWFHRNQPSRTFDVLRRMFQETDPWLRSDLEYTRFKDAAYTLKEYQRAILKNWPTPPSLRFNALRWLLLHVDQPGMRIWTWLCVWDMATKVHDTDPLRELNTLRIRYGTEAEDLTSYQLRQLNTPRFDNGIRDILSIFSKRHFTPSMPCAMALRYGLHAGIEPRFIAEAFVNLLPSLDVSLACEIYQWILRKLAEDEAYIHSVVFTVLALPSQTAVTKNGPHTRDLRPLLVTVVAEVSGTPCVPLREQACAIALYFREMRTHNVSIFDARGDLQKLLVAAIASLVSRQCTRGDDPEMSIPADERTVLAALASAVDEVFDELGDPGRDDRRAAAHLARPSYRRVYLDLLSTDRHATQAVLEESFERNIAPLALAYSADEQRSPGVASLHADLEPARASGNEGAPTGTTPGIQIIITAPETEHPSSARAYTAPREERTMSGAPHALQALDVAETPLPVADPS